MASVPGMGILFQPNSVVNGERHGYPRLFVVRARLGHTTAHGATIVVALNSVVLLLSCSFLIVQ
jgi:hypothetical protein